MRLTHHPEVTSIRETSEIVLFTDGGKEITLPIQDLPPTYADEMEGALPTPRPPKRGLLREGKKFVRDDQNRPLPDYDWDDAAYTRDLRHMRTLQLVYFVTEGVVQGNLDFEADKGTLGDQEYYEAVLKEMKAFGFGGGQVKRIADAVKELSGITDEELDAAKADFT